MIRSMCCRLQLDLRELLKRGNGLFGSAEQTGSRSVWSRLTCARLGYLFKGERRGASLRDLDRAARTWPRCPWKSSARRFKSTLITGSSPTPSATWARCDNHFSTIGVNGMNEMVRNFTRRRRTTSPTREGPRHVQCASSITSATRMVEFQEAETGHMYNLEATPAEGTTYRFAKEDQQALPGHSPGRHAASSPTTRTPLSFPWVTPTIRSRLLKMQEDLQRKYTGGTVLAPVHERSASARPKPASELVRRYAHAPSSSPYITITPTFSICPEHGYLSGRHDFCPKCDAELLAAKKARELQKAA